MKLFGLIIDKNISWKAHADLVQNKRSENIELLYRASSLFDK